MLNKDKKVKIIWPNGLITICMPGEDWFKAAHEANVVIPSGCLGGSCGACEIEANGKVLRACVSKIPEEEEIEVEFFNDPYW